MTLEPGMPVSPLGKADLMVVTPTVGSEPL